MSWKVNFGDGKSVDFDDLPPEFFGKIAEDDRTASWYGVYLAPAGDDKRLYKVIRACAEHVGVEVPRPPANMRDAQKLLDMLEQTEDVADMPMADGVPLGDTATPATDSSSTSPEDTDGPSPSVELNPSATS